MRWRCLRSSARRFWICKLFFSEKKRKKKKSSSYLVLRDLCRLQLFKRLAFCGADLETAVLEHLLDADFELGGGLEAGVDRVAGDGLLFWGVEREREMVRASIVLHKGQPLVQLGLGLRVRGLAIDAILEGRGEGSREDLGLSAEVSHLALEVSKASRSLQRAHQLCQCGGCFAAPTTGSHVELALLPAIIVRERAGRKKKNKPYHDSVFS